MTHSAAEMLWKARLDGATLDRTSLSEISDVATAYRAQRQQITATGKPVCGWKLGATAVPSLALIGVSEPFHAPILSEVNYSSGQTVPICAAHQPMLETEFAIRLGSDLPPRSGDYSRAEVEPAIASVHASFEIVACRLEGGFKGAGPLVIADNGVNAAIVLGDAIPKNLWGAPESITVNVSVNGSAVAQGTSGALMWDHIFDALVWLANRQSETVRPLQKGDVIMSGTCAGVIPIAAKDSVVATFGASSVVRARFSVMNQTS